MDAQLSRRSPTSAAAAPTASAEPNLNFAYAMVGLALVAIWLSVALASIFSPVQVSGYYHEHQPIAAYGDWLWGAIATGFVITAAAVGLRAKVVNQMPWTVIGAGVSVVWVAAALVSIFSPVLKTGTDPTLIPLAAYLAPIVAVVVTGILTSFAKTTFPDLRTTAEPAVLQGTDTVTKLRQLSALRDSATITPEDYEKKKAELLSRF